MGKKKILHGLNHSEYEHPFDKKALKVLTHTPGLSTIGKFITRNSIEKLYTVQYTGSCLKITKQNYPSIFDYLLQACDILEIKSMPELYIERDYDINAYTIGCENPIIVLTSGLIDSCDDDEILFIIGHECGHVKSNHMLYHMMAQLINVGIDIVPAGKFISFPLQFAIYYWNRMSEFTADRAGLLCCQNIKSVSRAFIKMTGLPEKLYKNIEPKSFIEQAQEFQNLNYESLNKIAKTILIAQSDHP